MSELSAAVAVGTRVLELDRGGGETRIRRPRAPAPVVGGIAAQGVREDLDRHLVFLDGRPVPRGGTDQCVISRAAIHQQIAQVIEDVDRVVHDGMIQNAGRPVGPLEEEVHRYRRPEPVVGPDTSHGEEEIAPAPDPVHEHVGRGARDVPFNGGRASVQEELAMLLLGRVQELLGRRNRGNRLIEPWLRCGFGATRNGEPGKDGKKNPCSNDGTSGHLYSFDHTDLGGERVS